MICDALIPNQPCQWVEDRPFLLWDVGPRKVLEHWMDTLFLMNATLRLWLEEPDEEVYDFVCGTFPLSRHAQADTGPPKPGADACVFLDCSGHLIVRRGPRLTSCLPRQPVSRTWFAMVRKWLDDLGAAGSQTPELERQIAPGVFTGHHCDISPDTTFTGPCWIGSRCTIRSATIGPYAVVSDDCVIARGAEISQSYLTAGAVVPPRARMTGVAAGPSGVIAHHTGARLAAGLR